MSFSIGKVFNSAKGKLGDSLNKNLGDGAVTLGTGLKYIGGNLVNEFARTHGILKSVNSSSIYDSPFPLGAEWEPDPAYTVTFAFTDPNTKTQSIVRGYMPDTISMGLSAEYSSPLESIGEMASGAGGPVSAIAKMFGYKVSANMFSMVLWSGSSHMDLTLELRFVALQDTYKDVIEPIRKLTGLITPTIESFSVTSGPIQLGMMLNPGPSLEFVGDPSLINNIQAAASDVENAAGGFVTATNGALQSGFSGESTATQTVAAIGGAGLEALGGTINNLLKNVRVKNNISVTLGEFAYLKSIVVKDVSSAYNVKTDLEGNWTDATVSVQIGTFVSPTNIDIPDLIGYNVGAGAPKEGTSTSVSGLNDALGKSIGGFIEKGTNEIPKITDVVGDIGAKVSSVSKTLRNTVLGNQSQLGKDAGLGYKLATGIFDKPSNIKLPGMSASDAAEFNAGLRL